MLIFSTSFFTSQCYKTQMEMQKYRLITDREEKGMEKEFVLDYYDEEEKLRIQYHYWCKNGRFYRECEREDGLSTKTRRISEESYICALEEYYNA